jgi:hypothetical protein
VLFSGSLWIDAAEEGRRQPPPGRASLKRIRLVLREHGGEVRAVAFHGRFECRAVFARTLD